MNTRRQERTGQSNAAHSDLEPCAENLAVERPTQPTSGPALVCTQTEGLQDAPSAAGTQGLAASTRALSNLCRALLLVTLQMVGW